ncbi:response regulator [Aegicerativicinus sediminis]|uniref:response regulator n=1 Tax=Aegicerativicinus sediminis TaxID=2893202 RepID=UPI001E41AEE3|nr:response regulator transcription factor [Aegicerativicinus sediminis]
MVKVLIVDNHPVVLAGLRAIIESTPDFEVVGSIKTGVEIFEFVRRYKVDLIISEIDLPELNGITALRAIKKEHQQLKVLIFSHQPEEIYAISSLKAGASAYVPKSIDIDKFIYALRKVAEGEVYLTDKMSKQLEYDDTKKTKSRMFKRLSTREVEVLKLLSSGKKNKEIAKELDINEKTVSTYKSRLFKKLNVTNLVDLIHQAEHQDMV